MLQWKFSVLCGQLFFFLHEILSLTCYFDISSRRPFANPIFCWWGFPWELQILSQRQESRSWKCWPYQHLLQPIWLPIFLQEFAERCSKCCKSWEFWSRLRINTQMRTRSYSKMQLQILAQAYIKEEKERARISLNKKRANQS